MQDEGAAIISKVWNFCHVLRDDGVSYTDYIDQISYLLFLKLDDEQSKHPFNKQSSIPQKYNWDSLQRKSGRELKDHYYDLLRNLGKQNGLLGLIFRDAKDATKRPATLSQLIHLIDSHTWSGMSVDIKGEIYEGLLEKNAQDTKSGAGQYFTPRVLIDCIIKAIQPQPRETVGEPACGTGGFILGIQKYIIQNNRHLDKRDHQFLKNQTFYACDIASDIIRLCAMNMHLHGIQMDETSLVDTDSLSQPAPDTFDLVLTNPPFGNKASSRSITETGKVITESRTYEREDFWVSSRNKQLNFLQHIYSMLKIGGRCAVVVPDNVLFDTTNAATIIRKKLLWACDVHTLLRLPTGIFYAQGVKTNVLFFDKQLPNPDKPLTDTVWVYDLRTGISFSKTNKMQSNDLKDFLKCYNPNNRRKRRQTKRFHSYTYEEIAKDDKLSLDLRWIDPQQEQFNLLPPLEIAKNIRKELDGSRKSLDKIIALLNEDESR